MVKGKSDKWDLSKLPEPSESGVYWFGGYGFPPAIMPIESDTTRLGCYFLVLPSKDDNDCGVVFGADNKLKAFETALAALSELRRRLS